MKTLEVCRIEPAATGTSDNLSPPTLLPLTFFDILWLRLPPVERLFYYEFPHSSSFLFDSVLPKLKQSLSVALHHYLPLAGNLCWPQGSHKPVVKYVAGDAVCFTVAESDAHFNHLSGTDLCEATECRHLIPHLTASIDQASVMALQVTLFPNSGFCIGISSHHAVLDGKTSTSFMKSWAYICYNLIQSSSSPTLPPELTPFYDRAAINDPNELETRYLTAWLNQSGPNNRSLKFWDLQLDLESTRGVFELTRPNIERLKQFVEDNYIQDGKLHLSTVTLSLAYAWVLKVKAEETKATKVYLTMPVDCRHRLEPPIPATYFGNCIVGRFAVAETVDLLGENGLILAMEAISEALETLKDGVLCGAENMVSVLQNKLYTDNYKKMIGSAGTPRFLVYSADFGWGRPKKVEITSVDRTAAIWVSESKNGEGGVEIGLVLKRGAMDAFASLFVKGLENL